MSKMGNELERSLDANKYPLLEITKDLLTFVECFGGYRHFYDSPENCSHCFLIKEATEVINAIDKR